MAETPEEVIVEASVRNGTVKFVIDDDDNLEALDKALYRWTKSAVGNRLGLDVETLDVKRP